MSFTKLHELNQTLSQYLLDTFSIHILDPINLIAFLILYVAVIAILYLVLKVVFEDSYSDDLGK